MSPVANMPAFQSCLETGLTTSHLFLDPQLSSIMELSLTEIFLYTLIFFTSTFESHRAGSRKSGTIGLTMLLHDCCQ